MERMFMLPVIALITMVLTWARRGEQRKHAVSILLCAAIAVSMCVPAVSAAKAESVAVPVLADEQVLVNGAKAAQIGTVTYSASGETYALDPTTARVRVAMADNLSFEGVIYAPVGETISWVRVDIYDAMTAQPYTVGAEYFRVDGMKAAQYDLANIPEMMIGQVIGNNGFALAEGGKYIIMLSVGDSNGNGFADLDAVIEESQGPSVLMTVKMSPENCVHPHSDYVYMRHSSGEIRKHSYGDSLTHQVEPLYERYCGLCDSFLMNIWGAGTAEEHTLGVGGTCVECGSYDDAAVEIAEDAIIGEETAEEEITEEETTVEGIIQDAADALKKLFEAIVAATNPERSVNVVTSWENDVLAVGDALTLTAELTGYEGLDYTIFWQCDMGSGFEDIPVADGHQSIQFVVDEQNKVWPWRAGVRIDVEIEDAQAGAPIETAEDQEAAE